MYKFYAIGSDGRVEDILDECPCANTQEAISYGCNLVDGRDIEIWSDRNRFIARVRSNTRRKRA